MLSNIVDIDISSKRYSLYLPNFEEDYIQKYIYQEKKPYELEMLKDMSGRLNSKSLFLDIGSNIGNHTLFLSSISACQAIAFEPNEFLCNALMESIKLNSLEKKVQVIHCALGDKEGFGSFEKEIPQNLGMQRIIETNGNIKIHRLDNIPISQKIDMIKIDVEGMELSILKGAAELLKKDRPFLYIEAHNIEFFEEIKSYLDTFSYIYCDTFNATPTHLFIHGTYLKKDVDHIIPFLSKKAEIFYTVKKKEGLIKSAHIKSKKTFNLYEEECLKTRSYLEKLNQEQKENRELFKEYKSNQKDIISFTNSLEEERKKGFFTRLKNRISPKVLQ